MDYSSRRVKGNRNASYSTNSSSWSGDQTFGVGIKHNINEINKSSGSGLNERNIFDDYNDLIKHQYEEPNKIITNGVKSSSINKNHSSSNSSADGKFLDLQQKCLHY